MQNPTERPHVATAGADFGVRIPGLEHAPCSQRACVMMSAFGRVERIALRAVVACADIPHRPLRASPVSCARNPSHRDNGNRTRVAMRPEIGCITVPNCSSSHRKSEKEYIPTFFIAAQSYQKANCFSIRTGGVRTRFMVQCFRPLTRLSGTRHVKRTNPSSPMHLPAQGLGR